MDFIFVRIGAEPDQLFGDARVTANQYRNAIAILFELDGVPGPIAAVAFSRAAEKLPIKTKMVVRLGEPTTQD